MNIIVTGGAGYIGSHTVVELLSEGHTVEIIDNYSNSSPEVLDRIKVITGVKPTLHEVDIRDGDALKKVLGGKTFDCCIHFAGLKSVKESVDYPLEYYDNNFVGTVNLLRILKELGCKKLIFSSSATVYGELSQSPLAEDAPTGECTNPYGWSKFMIEQLLSDVQKADDWDITLLRYFNPVGAHESGLIGEEPGGIPNNLMPYITKVAIGEFDHLNIFGDDYDTIDGTGVRDFIHVVDLARGHIKAMDKMLDPSHANSLAVYNLGTGRGYSVLELVKAFEKATGVEIPYVTAERRPGDIATCYANPKKAEDELGWRAEKDIVNMCESAWKWQSNNPNGYKEV